MKRKKNACKKSHAQAHTCLVFCSPYFRMLLACFCQAVLCYTYCGTFAVANDSQNPHKMENIMATTIEWKCARTHTHTHMLTQQQNSTAHTKECVSTIFPIHAWWKFANIYVLCSSYAVHFIAFVCHITERNFLPCELNKSCTILIISLIPTLFSSTKIGGACAIQMDFGLIFWTGVYRKINIETVNCESAPLVRHIFGISFAKVKRKLTKPRKWKKKPKKVIPNTNENSIRLKMQRKYVLRQKERERELWLLVNRWKCYTENATKANVLHIFISGNSSRALESWTMKYSHSNTWCWKKTNQNEMYTTILHYIFTSWRLCVFVFVSGVSNFWCNNGSTLHHHRSLAARHGNSVVSCLFDSKYIKPSVFKYRFDCYTTIESGTA